MTLLPEPFEPEPTDQLLRQTLEVVAGNDDLGARPAEAVTDCGVTPGHNRLEDREGA